MKLPQRNTATVLAMIPLALALAACNKTDDAAKTDAASADAAKTDAAASADASKPAGDAIPGLKDEKAKVSYMVGMDIAKTLKPIKDEVDIATMTQAIEATFADKKLLMDDAQADAVRQAFAQRLQAKQVAEAKAKAEKNKADGEAFLASNGKKPEVKTTASGLQYQVVTEGKGPKPKATDMVRVHYKGTLLDGSTFDSSYDRKEPAEFMLNQVIPGWSEGVALMPVGSKYTFWVPSKLAYGDKGTPGGPIGPDAMLTFEVELLDIVKPDATPAAPAQGE